MTAATVYKLLGTEPRVLHSANCAPSLVPLRGIISIYKLIFFLNLGCMSVYMWSQFSLSSYLCSGNQSHVTRLAWWRLSLLGHLVAYPHTSYLWYKQPLTFNHHFSLWKKIRLQKTNKQTIQHNKWSAVSWNLKERGQLYKATIMFQSMVTMVSYSQRTSGVHSAFWATISLQFNANDELKQKEHMQRP